MNIRKLFILAGVIFCFGCKERILPPPYSDYIFVKNKLRLTATKLVADIAGMGCVKIAAEKGGYGNDFSLEHISVETGSITFHGDNGSITFLADNMIRLDLPGITGEFSCNYKEKEYGGQIFFNSPQLMVFVSGFFDRGHYQDLEKNNPEIKQAMAKKNFDLALSLSLKLFTLHVPHESNENYVFINLPVTISSDFKGSCGELYVLSNWYNGKN